MEGSTPISERASQEGDLAQTPRRMARSIRALWVGLTVLVVTSFAALLYYGGEIYQMAPPIPEAVASADGEVIFDREDVLRGQDVWRSIGGHELGSVWGHGAYTAPDWTADWLHREAEWLVEHWSQEEFGAPFESLPLEQSAALQARLRGELRTNTHDPATGTIAVTPLRAEAIRAVQSHYVALFGDSPELDHLRESYAMPRSVIPDLERREAFTAFLFWAAWACVTERPGKEITYTHNWPPDDLVGNRPTGTMIVVSVVSFVLLLGGIGGLAWFFAASRDTWRSEAASAARRPAARDPGHSVHARHSQVLLGGGRAGSGADRGGHRHRPLRRGGNGVLRDSPFRAGSLLPVPHLARAAGHAVDRHLVAGHRPVSGALDLGI